MTESGEDHGGKAFAFGPLAFTRRSVEESRERATAF